MKKPNYISPGKFSTTFFDEILRSKEFDDIYFSSENGQKESDHVFISGNHLKEIMPNSKNFIIGELGFGTGLNFLLTWKLFKELKIKDGYLDYISIEGYPLMKNQMNKVHEKHPNLQKLWVELQDALPPLWSGIHRLNLNHGKVRLTLIYNDVLEALKNSIFKADAWFLDGFSPNKNHDMWSLEVMSEIYRLTKPSGTFATFSSAGFVRRNLEKAGFDVKKIKGYNFKKEMSCGQKPGMEKSKEKFSKVVIVGGGVAGASIASSLRKRGYDPIVIEKKNKLAQGSSGNLAAVQHPRLTTVNTPNGRLSLSCYRYSRDLAKRLGVAIDDKSIIFGTPEREIKKQEKLLSQGWPSDLLRELTEEDKLEITSSKINLSGIVHDYGGTIKPIQFVKNLMPNDIEIIFGQEIIDINKDNNGWEVVLSNNQKINTEIIILACSEGLKKIRQTNIFNLQYTQGQITHIEKNKLKNLPKSNFSFSGYVTPPINDLITVGATFEKNSAKRNYVSNKANNINLNNIPEEISKSLFSEKIILDQLDGRVSMRVSTFDRMPMMGRIEKNLYILSALGARGMIMAPLLGDALASIISNQPSGLDIEMLKCCDPNRIERSFLA